MATSAPYTHSTSSLCPCHCLYLQKTPHPARPGSRGFPFTVPLFCSFLGPDVIALLYQPFVTYEYHCISLISRCTFFFSPHLTSEIRSGLTIASVLSFNWPCFSSLSSDINECCILPSLAS